MALDEEVEAEARTEEEAGAEGEEESEDEMEEVMTQEQLDKMKVKLPAMRPAGEGEAQERSQSSATDAMSSVGDPDVKGKKKRRRLDMDAGGNTAIGEEQRELKHPRTAPEVLANYTLQDLTPYMLKGRTRISLGNLVWDTDLRYGQMRRVKENIVQKYETALLVNGLPNTPYADAMLWHREGMHLSCLFAQYRTLFCINPQQFITPPEMIWIVRFTDRRIRSLSHSPATVLCFLCSILHSPPQRSSTSSSEANIG